ncbi:MAG: ABC transporter permease [Bacteroidetes bacterium]|nr:ABC transporter permease [Bacteroidota bacterium]
MEAYISAIILGLCLSSMALGIFMSMKIFNIPDITTDGSYTLGAVVSAVMLTQHIPIYIIIPTVILCGAMAGICTAIIHTRFKIDALLAGILVMTALYSINLTIMGRSNLPLIDTKNIFSSLHILSNSNYNSLIIVTIIIAVITTIIAYLLKTDFGIAMRATGNNSAMVRALGVSDNKMKIFGLAISNALTAFAGFLITQNQFYADINMGIGIVITGLGSVLIADALKSVFKVTSLSKQLLLVIAGSIIFQLVLAVTLAIGVNPNLLKLTTALFVLVIVVVTKIKSSKS